ncbi:hypothetical protein DSO57_1012733 [Entomophthora muscae]|uniref:Uncharacterized protein n=1 Tax=Entomophthora muscae TaxID=34485 RepID=A0ACC2U5A2_9FUNG|nr:hypothetical protein DSO57_1012733 [Entomophthora muscae]
MPFAFTCFIIAYGTCSFLVALYTIAIFYTEVDQPCHESYPLEHYANGNITGCFVLNEGMPILAGQRWVGPNFAAFHQTHPKKENLSKNCQEFGGLIGSRKLRSVTSTFQLSKSELRLGNITCPDHYICLTEASFQGKWILTKRTTASQAWRTITG